MRRSRSASSELSEATLGGIKAKEGSKSMGNLNQYGRRPYPDQEETSSMRSFHSTPGDMLTAGGKSSQRNRSVSESDANVEPQGPTYYRDIILEKEDNESFGFVILSSVQKTGPTIGEAWSVTLAIMLCCFVVTMSRCLQSKYNEMTFLCRFVYVVMLLVWTRPKKQ